ncbi:gp58-like family protein [Latilactobacillus sp. 5-91]|uniref:gp58-like family protein n=1 Tax=Latilactobacillus sp. 5-91 TaxID=3410924 RepID=UPI003C732CFC
MLKVSDAFNDAFAASGRELRARVTIGKSVYSSDDLTSVAYDSGAMTGEQFSIGSTYMNSAKITFSHLVEGLKQLDEVLLEFGIVKADGTTEYVKMGTFIIDDKIQMDRNNNSTTIECTDRMVMLGGAYKSKMSYPATIKSVAVEIANMAGVKANDTSFARLPNISINELVGYSYRDAIGIIAQFAMGFALFDRDGYLDIRTLVDSEFKIDPSQYFLKGLVKNETFFKLNGISCTVVTTSKDETGNETSKTTVLQSGSSSGAQIKLANNVMTQDVLDRMYEELKFTNYYPFSLNWNGNPAVEAGDWLTVEDLQGNEFKVPNMSYTITYNGGLTATSKADTSVGSPATYSYGGIISNVVNEIGGREGAEGNHIYEGTEEQEPLFPKEGDLWYKHVGPDTEERIYTNGAWKFLTSTKTSTDAKKAADEASKEAEEAKKQANKAVDGANQAVADAGFAKQQVIDVDKTANQAKADAAAAGQQAKDALTNAGAALTNAKNALDNVNKLDQTVKTEVTNINGQLSQKVNQTTFDTLKGTVTSQGTIINQNKAAIQLKADLSLVNTIKQTVTNNTATIDLNSKEIKLKANQSTVDSLNGTVKNLDAEQKIQAGQITQTVSKTELTSKLNGYATQTWTQGQIKTEADQINIGVQKVQTNLDNMQIGSRNYLLNSDASDGTNHWNVYNNEWVIDKSVAIDGIASFRGKTAEVWSGGTVNGIWQAMSNISPNSNILVSFYAKADKNGASLHSEPNGGVGAKDFTLTTDWKRYSYSGTLKSAAVYWMMKTIGANYWLAKPQVETGTKVTDYHRAVEDYTSQVEFSQLKITVNSVQTTVSNKADKSQVTQLAGQITSAIQSIDKLNTEYTQVQQTIKGIQTTVGNKADKSQVTQLAGQITSVVGSIGSDNLVVDGSFEHVAIGSKPLWWTLSYMPNNMVVIANPPASNATVRADAHVLKLTGAATGNVEPSGPFFSVTPGDEFYCEFKTRWSTTGLKGDVVLGLIFYDVDRKTITGAVGGQSKTAENWAKHSGVVKAPSNAVYAKAWVAWRNSNNAVAYVTVTDLIIRRNSATQSQITQLANDINLRVEKDKVVNQINISPEGILIDGKKVHITGQTSIDNAVIKDAMIADIRADKITAGTLNAANVNVINLNANNITTGTLKGANLSMNLNTGQVVFQKGYITSADGRIRFDLDSNYFRSLDYNNNGFEAKDGQFVWYNNWSGSNKNEIGRVMFDVLSEGNGGIAIQGKTGASLITSQAGVYVGTAGLNDKPNGVGISGNAFFWGNLDVMGKKNAVHVTSKGVVETPAYETAESYLGDIGEGITDEYGSALIHIDDLFNQIINTDHDYQVFISSYSNATIWVEERNATSFEVHSNIPNAKFAWEIKAKRRGYETDRLVKSEMKYEQLNKFHEKKVSA